ncbi:uncharacterized protein M437DRAFT_61911 [Aureobasidium melanogenum CBS 110374]|uniref:F-box domain-containing protein n=1 Tax=Aureobasidium melanogenum (strain CBS 110374) TaxID=1043003 RepID=A0A074WC51_AURM1|nr:uncharacterized protein M437DRAFT_61911 [Aureobasidium melanogenum CBS 110374]KEQ67512.1 hypothetical protein M437DRAFT_61911 [Aureobasidium melanogenum CBS 110374]
MDPLMAAQRVLETPELLEMILAELHPCQLLVSQRVNTLWHDLISNSPQLQQLLFMRPSWPKAKPFDSHLSCEANRPSPRPRNNMMLRRVLGGRYPTFTPRVTSQKDEEEYADKGVEAPDANPDDISSIPRSVTSPSSYWTWDVNVMYPSDKLPTEDAAVLYEKASWRRMYLCQPPCTELYLARRWCRAARPAISSEDGITMETFIEKATKARELWNQLFISSDGDWHFEGPMRSK